MCFSCSLNSSNVVDWLFIPGHYAARDREYLQLFVERCLYSMTEILGDTVAALDRFKNEGIQQLGECQWWLSLTYVVPDSPYLKDSQRRSAKMRFNTATVATFFAGVSATTLQFSAGFNETRPEIAANILWFSSLVLSVFSAIIALLSMTWKQAMLYVTSPNIPAVFWHT